jgi:acid phosphatase family membrane protein YuiD
MACAVGRASCREQHVEGDITVWFKAVFGGMAHNPALICALCAIIIAQGIKVPIYWLTNRTWDPGKAVSTGSMPSSHSAAVAALATVVGMRSGTASPLFAACVIFGVIVMYDAAGIRRHAGEQAVALNNLAAEIGKYIDRRFMGPNEVYEKRLKEMLGHQPLEVFMGAALGIVIGVVGAWILRGL